MRQAPRDLRLHREPHLECIWGAMLIFVASLGRQFIRPTNVVVNEPTYHSSISNGLKMAFLRDLGSLCLRYLPTRTDGQKYQAVYQIVPLRRRGLSQTRHTLTNEPDKTKQKLRTTFTKKELHPDVWH
jgi:hypothetical protein